MKVRSFARSAVALAVGSSMAAAFAWAFVNVPESSIGALGLSALFVVLTAVTIGLATAAGIAFAHDDSPGVAARRAATALPSFLGALAVLAVLWWITGLVDGWWNAHRGEIDAICLRYLGVTRTGPLHVAEFWTTWLSRWVLGLSVLAGMTAWGTRGGLRTAGRGLRLSIRLVPLAAAAAGVLIVSEGLWRLAFWRPASLPASSAEVIFAAMKLGVLYLVTIAIAALVLRIYGRAVGHSVP